MDLELGMSISRGKHLARDSCYQPTVSRKDSIRESKSVLSKSLLEECISFTRDFWHT